MNLERMHFQKVRMDIQINAKEVNGLYEPRTRNKK